MLMEKPDMIQLHPTVPEDLPDLLGWVGSEAQMVLWSGPNFSWPLDLEKLDAYLAESHAGTRLAWTAPDPDSATPVGHVSLTLQDHGRTGRLGRVLVAPNARHVGHRRAVTQAAVTAGFAEGRIDAMTLGVYRRNTTARHLYEQLSFKTTAIVENAATVNGKPWDHIEMRLPGHRDSQQGENQSSRLLVRSDGAIRMFAERVLAKQQKVMTPPATTRLAVVCSSLSGPGRGPRPTRPRG
jgi:RimJ/RimL family protein N-acetyltransferase